MKILKIENSRSGQWAIQRPHSSEGQDQRRIPKFSKQFRFSSWIIWYISIGQIEFQVNSPADSLDSLLSQVLAHLSHSFHEFSCFFKAVRRSCRVWALISPRTAVSKHPVFRHRQSSHDNLQQQQQQHFGCPVNPKDDVQLLGNMYCDLGQELSFFERFHE